ncbi:MAG: hypothetical protein IKU44_00245 [Firmicutes bacterium]|nr:hypothetical protein [Bacillota bacterium]
MPLTGKERFEEALSKAGTNTYPVTLSYEMLYFRDQIYPQCKTPWWYAYSKDVYQRVERTCELIDSTDLDWVYIRDHTLKPETDDLSIEVTDDGHVFQHSKTQGTSMEIPSPLVGGTKPIDKYGDVSLDSMDVLQKILWEEQKFNEQIITHDDLRRATALEVKRRYPDKFTYAIVFAPMVKFFLLFGLYKGMLYVASKPGFVKYFCDKYLEISLAEIQNAASHGADCIQIDVMYLDMIHPDFYREFGLPGILAMKEACKDLNMKSLVNFLGDSTKHIKDTLSIGADIYHFEDSNGNDKNNILRIADAIEGKAVLQGNLNAIEILQDGSDEDLKREIQRQKEAGKRNKNRFIMCTGSPVTPFTPKERVEAYIRLCKEE